MTLYGTLKPKTAKNLSFTLRNIKFGQCLSPRLMIFG
jgi:hypothetical protein